MTTMRRARAILGAAAALLSFAGCSSDTASITPLQWQKVHTSTTGLNGSVLGLDAPGTFDEIGNFTVSAFKDGGVTFLAGQFDSGGLTTPSVFLDGDTWNMYYAGFDTSGRFLAGLARAPKR